MATIDDNLAQAITKALNEDQLIISNLDKVVYGPGNVTITRKDGTQVTGPSWPQMLVNSNNPINWRGLLPTNANLNTYGPTAANYGQWGQNSATTATIANGFPEDNAVGILEIIQGGSFGLTQRYTISRTGNIYIRTLAASWNGTDGPWTTWSLSGVNSVPGYYTADMNNLLTPGTWSIPSAVTNGPIPTGQTVTPPGICRVELRSSANSVVQTFTSIVTTASFMNLTYTRTLSGVTWSAWELQGSGAMKDIGLISPTVQIANFNWQTAVFQNGSLLNVNTSNWVNPPAELSSLPSGSVFLQVTGRAGLDSVTSAWVQIVATQILLSGARRTFNITGYGANGARTWSVREVVYYEEAPFPDVWAPLNDDLRLLAGFAPADTIPGTSYTLPSKSIPFTRASTATYIDKSGGVSAAAINEPRFEREGLLMEGQGTNMVLYSGDLSASWWPKARCTTTSGFAAPDGSNSATKLMPTSELGSHYISKTLPVTTGGIYTLSYFVKAGEYTGCRLSFSGTLAVDGKSCDFDLVAGTMKPLGTTGTPTITPLSNGWYRCSITSDAMAADGTVNFNIWVLDENGNSQGYTGDGVKGIYVWGAQLEANPVLTSYIPTTSAAATRAQETLRLQPSGNIGYGVLGDLFNRTISFELSVNAFVPTSAGYFNLLATVGVQNDIILRIATSAVSSLRSSGSINPSISVTYPFSRQIYTQTIDTNNTLMSYFNGQVGSRTGAPTAPTGVPTTVNFSSTVQLVYHIRNFRIWHRVLTDNQINGLR